MYEPTYWKDEVVENPYRYKKLRTRTEALNTSLIQEKSCRKALSRAQLISITWSRESWKDMK